MLYTMSLNSKARYLVVCLLVMQALGLAAQRVVHYDLYVTDTTVTFGGKEKSAIAINGSIPAPTLYFTEGDTAEIDVHNTLRTETSIHWHGLILPNEQDGVPYLTTAPIKAGTVHHYRFPVVQNGTYWYHSHTKLQEQSGMYGAFIIHKKEEPPMREFVMVLSEWTNEKPNEVHRSLHNANDWYSIKKGSSQAYSQAVGHGYLGQRLKSDWLRMTPMDLSDVYYNRFLVNGKPETDAGPLRAGEKIRLRIVNGGASTYFWLRYAGGKITVVANDGMDTQPVEVDRLIIAVAETYDLIVTVPADSVAFEFLATSEDRTGHSSVWLGEGVKKLTSPMPRPDYFEGLKMMNGMMRLNGSMDDMGMNMSNQKMDMNIVAYPEVREQMPVTLNYAMLRSPVKTTLPDAPTRTLRFRLTGNMLRYLWTVDNKTISESDKILMKQGENVRIIIENASMMRHPMHLHGHFFRVLNGQGEYAPLKNVLDIMPMEIDTIEFNASEQYGDWFFHCHILYHMMSGMGRIFRYENTPPNPQLPDPALAQRKLFSDDRQWHTMLHIALETNGSDGELMRSNKRNIISAEWRLHTMFWEDYEVETHYTRFIGRQQFLRAYAGFDTRYRKNTNPEANLFGQTNTKDHRNVFCVGLQYTLPFFLLSEFRVDQQGKVRFQIGREDIPLTPRLRMSFMANTDLEYMAGFRYIVTKKFSLSTHYDSDMKLGVGLSLTY